MSILLIRHGETALNVARVLQPADTPLSPHGIAQAEALAQRLARTVGVTAILSSDLPRALRTAEAIAAATGALLETSALLHERNYGTLRGRLYESLGFDPMTMDDAPSDGESGETFRRRVAAAFADAVVRHRALVPAPDRPRAGDTTGARHLAVVTHGLVIREMLASHVALDHGMTLPAGIGNSALTIIEPGPPHRARLVDCSAHLNALGFGAGHRLSGG